MSSHFSPSFLRTCKRWPPCWNISVFIAIWFRFGKMGLYVNCVFWVMQKCRKRVGFKICSFRVVSSFNLLEMEWQIRGCVCVCAAYERFPLEGCKMTIFEIVLSDIFHLVLTMNKHTHRKKEGKKSVVLLFPSRSFGLSPELDALCNVLHLKKRICITWNALLVLLLLLFFFSCLLNFFDIILIRFTLSLLPHVKTHSQSFAVSQ